MSRIAARVVPLGDLRGLAAWRCSRRTPDEGHPPSKYRSPTTPGRAFLYEQNSAVDAILALFALGKKGYCSLTVPTNSAGLGHGLLILSDTSARAVCTHVAAHPKTTRLTIHKPNAMLGSALRNEAFILIRSTAVFVLHHRQT